jgi:tripartite-type tricarboxylate transporter receptor subunit TctC
MKRSMLVACVLAAAAAAQAQPCPDKNVMYWQAFPPGGESDLSARHHQLVLKKKCPAIETVIQYKAGAGGALLWSSTNTLPADGVNIVGINLPHMVLQPMEGNVTYKIEDVTPVYWFHFTPDALVVPEQSPIKSWADFIKAAKDKPGQLNLGGSGLNSANHAAHERMNAAFHIRTTYVPFKGTGDMTMAVLGGHVDGSMTYTAFAINNKTKVRALAVAMDKRHPLLPDTPTFKELGFADVEFYIWAGLFAPKGLPEPVMARLREGMRQVMNDPAVVRTFENAGSPAAYQDAADFAHFVEADSARLIASVHKIGKVE